jgi:hypothetical protein
MMHQAELLISGPLPGQFRPDEHNHCVADHILIENCAAHLNQNICNLANLSPSHASSAIVFC